MKAIERTLIVLVATTSLLVAGCGKVTEKQGTDLSDILFENGTQLGNGDAEFEIKDSYILPEGTYTMKGWIYICDGASLTIEPGTVIKGDKATKAALIVERGGKLYAQGTASEPIVFTSAQPAGSRRPGDWGGLIMCGKARNNQTEMIIEGGPRSKHGGDDDADDSGVLSYVRVEFAGYPFATDQEINGVTFGSVGSGTKVDHVQVSYSNDDSYEWFGGDVDCKYLIAYRGWDDDFDTDDGYSGKVQFGLSIRDPKIADQSVSNGFESDNCADGTEVAPVTSCVFSNMTLVGPVGQDSGFENNSEYIDGGDLNPQNGSKLGQFQAAFHIRRNSNMCCFNSVVIGFPVGIIIENDKGSATQEAATDGSLEISNVFMAGMTIIGSDKNKSFVDGYTDDSGTPDENVESFSARYFKSVASDSCIAVSDLKLNSAYAPMTGSPLIGAASFTDSKLSSGFDKVSYAGAFASESDGWMSGWTDFDPQNTVY
ncbi:MAG: hypothetical protein LKK19_06315 [Bacteroidales bacterium]|jgi:hypothetical protein|nr:hypothetical protein [Bacteroidales bacterium]MCI2122299.1 hypothetical protein [Bacteroidales bacterium]MCI2145063.1 hypothetical protein [Bacteroidales bacterium]